MNYTNQYLQSLADGQEIDVTRLVNHIVQDAVAVKASDVHIEPWESSLAVRIRLNGVLTELVHLPRDTTEKVTGRLKVMANLVSYQTDLPQEGHVPTSEEIGNVELRVSVFPTVRGEKTVVRIFDPENRKFDLTTLGFDDIALDNFRKLLAKPSGLILLTGPTGCGKTTTIYSALSHLSEKHGPTISIVTVEDPVEASLPLVTQSQVNRAKEFTYPTALRSLMRQDPEIIMIGEIRDPETAAIAVQAGLSGHLVISTIHSGSSTGVFARLMNMEIEPFLLSSSVIGVMGLRLIRLNCESCSIPYEPEPNILRQLPEINFDEATFRRGSGCPDCLHTGFGKRTALAEFLMVDDAVREGILQKVSSRTLQEMAVKNGMRTLWQLGLQRALAGDTTVEEILRVIAMDQL